MKLNNSGSEQIRRLALMLNYKVREETNNAKFEEVACNTDARFIPRQM